MQDDLFNDLVAYLSADVDHRGWASLTCPECGTEGTVKNSKCGFGPFRSAYIWKCFVCGSSGGLKNLADRVGYQSSNGRAINYKPPVRPQESPKREYTWIQEGQDLVSRYEAHKRKIELWQGYKRLSLDTIELNRLGVGVLPASSCHHERLIVPMFDGQQNLVGLRGRRLNCDCPQKWTVPGGTVLDKLPLYNHEALKSGCVVWIVENVVDALQLTEVTEYIGLAVYSTSYWKPEWAAEIAAIKPELVVVCLDNDLPGNGGADRRDEFIKRWQAEHPGAKIPEAAGIKRVNTLLESGVPAILYDWGRAEYKADIGTLLME